ncbi:TIGR03943 family putative permease subunit, partial [Streptococcus sobrinus]
EVMELIYLYPDRFVGKTITYTGFVYNDTNQKDHQFLFRFGIIHCIADSGVYGLSTRGNKQHYENNTWIQATGTIHIEYNQALKQSLPVLEMSKCQQVTKPDNPYVYRVF